MQFTKKTYSMLTGKHSKEEYIEQIGKLANVANKRAKSLQKAIKSGRIREASTALRLYDKVLNFTSEKSLVLPYISTGKTIYKNMSISDLRQVERGILKFLSSDLSTPKGVLDAKNKTVDKLKERYGLDISKMSNNEIEKLFISVQRLVAKNASVYSSKQIITYVAEALKSGQFEDVMNELKEAYPTEYSKGDLTITMTRVSNLSKADRISWYKKGLKLKHSYNRNMNNEIKQKDW